MVRYIYWDVLLLTNLAVNYIILLAAGKLSYRNISHWRLALSSLLGSVYAVSALVVPLKAAYSLPARIAFGLFMVALSYPGARGIALLRVTLCFFLCSAVAAGTALALQSFGGRIAAQATLFQGEAVVHWYVVAFSLAVLAALPVLANMNGYSSLRRLPLMTIEVSIGGKTLGLTGLVDTGNNLRDPVSGLPVIVIDWDALRNLMPPGVSAFFMSTWDAIPAGLPETSVGTRLRLVPYESLSGKMGVLPGFRPDRLALVGKNGLRVFKNAIVCASQERLSPSGLYQALLHPDLVNP
ncbi:MAG TPA: sigma-E processing peptidase SpoIIGA [Firmicutes bacterium]|nr:sigma-E processing peptidase SpoIIGA [Candidatus Fermentithermobacillaceae bacterium]